MRNLTGFLQDPSYILLPGGEAELDLQPMIFACSLRQPSRQELELTVLVSAQNPSCNPQLLVNAIETYLPEPFR